MGVWPRSATAAAASANLFSGKQSHLGDLFWRGVVIDIGVANENGACRQHQHVHRVVVIDAFAAANHLIYIMKMQVMRAERAANHTVCFAFVHHHGADQRKASAHFDLGISLRHAASCGEHVVTLPIIAITFIPFRVDDIDIFVQLQPQSELLNTLG